MHTQQSKRGGNMQMNCRQHSDLASYFAENIRSSKPTNFCTWLQYGQIIHIMKFVCLKILTLKASHCRQCWEGGEKLNNTQPEAAWFCFCHFWGVRREEASVIQISSVEVTQKQLFFFLNVAKIRSALMETTVSSLKKMFLDFKGTGKWRHGRKKK